MRTVVSALACVSSTMFARAEKGGGGVSLAPDDAIQVGIFGPGPATIVESVFADYDYGGHNKAVPVWLITYDRDGEKYEQPYSVGSGWRVSSDGESLIPKNGQTGLPDSCNAMLMLLSMKQAAEAVKGLDINKLLKSGNPRALEGMEVVLKREAQPDRGLEPKKGQEGKAAKTILLIEEIVNMPGEGKAAKSSGKAKAKAKDDDDEDDEPVKKSSKSKKPAADDDDEEEEAPAKSKKGGKAKAKDDDEINDENAGEVLIEVLEANDNEIELDDVELLVKKHLKGQDNAKEMAAYCAGDDFLSNETGWSVNAKKGIITLDEK